MLRFVFWNLNRKALGPLLELLAFQENADIIIFAENGMTPAETLAALNKQTTSYFYLPNIGTRKIQFFAKFGAGICPPVFESSNERLVIREYNPPIGEKILIAALHLPSKREFRERAQDSVAKMVSEDISETENRIGHRKTIVIGDFNMNPFEYGVILADSFNAVMSRKIAEKNSRIIQGTEYQYFYNPMWSYFGDADDLPGSYYYEKAVHDVYNWNIYDQVLLRPALIPRFDNTSLRIVRQIGQTNLLDKRGIIDRRTASDHLPITFSLKNL